MKWGLENVRALSLDGVTVPADPGDMTVVVGGDGAGKSTCLRVIAGLAEPEAGIARRPAKERIGYVPATVGMYPDLTIAENIDFTAGAYRLSSAERDSRASLLLKRTGLTAARDRLGGQLSGGMQRKLAVALALLHSPELLVIDEPTTGVDPVSRTELWRLIAGAALEGAAVVVSTTYVNEAARAARIVLLESGRELASGSPTDILRAVPGALTAMTAKERPTETSWRRGTSWRVWSPDGALPAGARPVTPDFEDAVVVASLAAGLSRDAEVPSAGAVSPGARLSHAGEPVRPRQPERKASAMTILAQTREATKRFGSFTAVNAVGISVEGGEVVGLLGGNGAGKTTLIRMLLGLLRPASGTIQLLGAPPSLSGRRRVGYVPQTLGLYAGLTVAENWAFTTEAFGISGTPLPDRIAAWRSDLVGGLPLGAQRRVAFAAALSHQPELLILDEPTSGVGPLASARLWEEVRQAAEHGAGVLVTTHNMEEAEQCDRLVVMAGGKVMARGTAGDIVSGRTVTEVRRTDLNRAFALLDGGGFPVQVQGSALRVAGTADAVTALLSGAGVEAATQTVPANLEEAFVAIVGSPPAASTAAGHAPASDTAFGGTPAGNAGGKP